MSSVAVEVPSEAIVSFYRGWEAYNKRPDVKSVSEFGVVDIDLAPQDIGEPEIFNSIQEIHARALELHDATPSDTDSGGLLKQKLAASVMFARVVGGEDIDFGQYTKTLTGVDIKRVPDAEITSSRIATETLLNEQGLAYTPEGLKEFKKRFEITGQTGIKEAFTNASRIGSSLMRKYLGTKPSDVDIQFEVLDESWAGYFSYDKTTGKFGVRVNTNGKRYPQTVGGVANVAGHEHTGHGTQLTMWHEALSRHEMDPALGMLTAHTPEVTQLEAVAQFAAHLVLDRGFWEHQFEAAHNIHILGTLHNALYDINTGSPVKETAAAMAEELPFLPSENLEAELDNLTSDLGKRAYMLCYYPALQLMRPLVKAPEEKLHSVLPILFGRPLSYEQMVALVG